MGGRARWALVAGLALLVGGVVVGPSLFDRGSDDPRPVAPTRPVPEVLSEPIAAGSYEWRPVPIGGGGFVTGIVSAVADGESVVYARTDVGGAYRWDPATSTWEQLLRASRLVDDDLGPDDYSVLSIAAAAADPDRVMVLVGTDYDPGDGEPTPRTGRVLRSDDGGQTWSSSDQRWFVNGNQDLRAGTERLAIDPDDPDVVLLGTQRDGLWRSSDGGRAWARVPTQQVPDGVREPSWAPQSGVSVVVTHGPSSDGAAVVAGVSGAGIYRSGDGGGTWHRIHDLDEGEVPTSATVAGDDLVLAVERPAEGTADLIRIVDVSGDAEVVAVDTPGGGSGRWDVAASPHDPRRLVLADHAVRDGHLWSSTDGGGSWRSHDVEISAPDVPWLEATDLAGYMSTGRLMFDPVDPELVWFAEGMGVWQARSLTDATVRWTSVASGIEEVVVSDLAHPPGGALHVVTADRQGFRFPDLGLVANQPLVDERFASGTRVDHSGGTPTVLAWVGAESNRPPDAAEPRGARSEDGGATWRELGSMDRSMYGGEVAISATDPNVIVWLPTHIEHPERFRDDPRGVWTSTDAGRSWDRSWPGDGDHSFHRFFWWITRRSLAADRVDGSFYLMSNEEAFFVSRDAGSTWDRAAHAPPCTVDVQCHVFGQLVAVPGRAGHLWASTAQGGLHRTTDAGATPWSAVSGVVEARAIAVGAPMDESGEPTIFVHGRTDDDGPLAVLRSADGGRSWTVVAEHPADVAAEITVLGADPDRPGRVYVGFRGVGAVYGDDPMLAPASGGGSP